MEKLKMAIKKYYNAHQISKSINILVLALMEKPDYTIRPLKCICNFLEPHNGWNRKVTATAAPEDQCYHCMHQLKEAFSDYEANTQRILPPSPDNRQCQYCYWYCSKKYAGDGSQMQLTKKYTKRGNFK